MLKEKEDSACGKPSKFALKRKKPDVMPWWAEGLKRAGTTGGKRTTTMVLMPADSSRKPIPR